MKRIDVKRFGPWAVVTGASSGIGAAFARELARRGFHLVLIARRLQALDTLAAELARAHGVDCRPVALDLAEPRFVSALRRTTDDVDVGLVVSNAGTATAAALVHWGAEELERDVAVNATAHARLAHHFAPKLAARRRGGIVLVSSIAGRQPVPYLASYAASKSFVTVLGESLHAELRPRGVTVTVLVAGPTDTRMRGAMGFGGSRLRPMSAERCAAEGLAALASGRAAWTPGRGIRLILALVPRRLVTRLLGRRIARMSAASSPRPVIAGVDGPRPASPEVKPV